MLTLPGVVAKAQTLTFTLNRGQLLALVNDSYWGVAANLASCVITYKSTEGNQRKRLVFDLSQTNPTDTESWSSKARNDFEIESIQLVSHDGEGYLLPASAIPSGKALKFLLSIHVHEVSASITAMLQSGSDLYIAGNFTSISYTSPNSSESGTYTRRNVAKFSQDAQGNWKLNAAFDAGFGSSGVKTMALNGNDLFIGGSFTSWASQTRNRVAKLNATTGALSAEWGAGSVAGNVNIGPFNGVSGTVNKIAIDGTDLVIAGNFTTYQRRFNGVNSTPATAYWMRVGHTTNLDSPKTSGPNAEIKDFTIYGTDTMWAVGPFSSWQGFLKSKVARAHSQNGGLEGSFTAPSLSGTPHAIALVDDKLLIVSDGTTVGGSADQSGTLTVNWLTGALAKSFTQQELPILAEARIAFDATHVFIAGWNNIAVFAPNMSAVRRLLRSTWATTAFGYWLTNVTFKPLAIAVSSTELFVAGDALSISGGAGTTPAFIDPSSKRLYLYDKAAGTRKAKL